MKQAQTTLFILLGLLILLFIGFFLFYQQEFLEQVVTPQSSATAAVQAMVQSCMDTIVSDALFIAGFQGGYIEITDSRKAISERQLHYYYYYQDISPNLTFIYDLMEAYILNNTVTCIEASSLLSIYNISIETEEGSVVIQSGAETTVDLLLAITIHEATTTTSLDSFTTTVPVAFEKMYGVAREIVETIAVSDPLICMTCLHELAEGNGVVLSINDYEQLSDYYVLFDQTTELYDAPYAFAFVVRTKEDFDPSGYFREESPLALELPSYTASIGEEFSLNINTEEFLSGIIPTFIEDPGYSITFSDYSPLFDIDPVLGTIVFTPTEEQRGTHTAMIKIEDTKGHVEYVSLELVIE